MAADGNFGDSVLSTIQAIPRPTAAPTAAPRESAAPRPNPPRDLPGLPTGDAGPLGFSTAAWVKMIVIAVLFAALYRFNLLRLWQKTNPFYGEANWGHSVVVPVVGLYYLFVRRDELLAAPVREVLPQVPTRNQLVSVGLTLVAAALLYFAVPPLIAPLAAKFAGGGERIPAVVAAVGLAVGAVAALALFLNWGLAFLIGGLILGSYGIWPGRNDYVWDCGMVVTLFGTVLTLCGWRVMRIAWFPIVFLICALPWPPLVYQMLAWPLQMLASRVAVLTLQVFQVDATVAGTKIVMPTGRALDVAEACAGLRSLMTFITLGAAVGFLSERPLWQKISVTAAAVPIAIFCNVLRVSGMGLLDFYVSQEFSEGFAHQFAGLIMLLPAFLLFVAVMWVLDRLFVEEADGDDVSAAQPAPIAPEAA